jgi:hypothetical protein
MVSRPKVSVGPSQVVLQTGRGLSVHQDMLTAEEARELAKSLMAAADALVPKRLEPPNSYEAYLYHWLTNTYSKPIVAHWLLVTKKWQMCGVKELSTPEEMWMVGWRYLKPVAP